MLNPAVSATVVNVFITQNVPEVNRNTKKQVLLPVVNHFDPKMLQDLAVLRYKYYALGESLTH